MRSDFTELLNGSVYFAINGKSSAGTILQFELFPPFSTLNSSSNVNIVEWLVSMTAVWVFVGSALTLSFGLANRDYNNNILLRTHGPYQDHKKWLAIHECTLQKRCLHMTNIGRSKALYPHHTCIVIRKSTENGCLYSSASLNRW